MGMTITCAMSKGGAGKTTFARLVLGALASSGRKVAGLDCDPNRALTNWVESISKADIDIRHEVDETKIIPSAAEFEASHDLLIIDTAGTAAQATIFAIGCADLVIMPVQSSSDDVIEAVKTAELVKSAAAMVKRKIPLRVVFRLSAEDAGGEAHPAGDCELRPQGLRHKIASARCL